MILIDGNEQPMDQERIARFVGEQNIGLVGIGVMTRMIAKTYRMADAIRATGVLVAMGPGRRVPLQERPLRTKLKICTEQDYLQAHLTAIARESRGRNPTTLRNAKQRIASVLKTLHV
jgi:hypothetical protein